MSIAIILDGDAKTALSDDLRRSLHSLSRERGHETAEVELHKTEVPPCIGCFLCMTKHPETCIYAKQIAGISEKVAIRSHVFFLAPVLFGNFSSTIKNVIDRGSHIVKNSNKCIRIVIGYSEDASDGERRTFIDIIAKHMGRADVVHPTSEESYEVFFTRSASDNDGICESVKRIMEQGGRDV